VGEVKSRPVRAFAQGSPVDVGTSEDARAYIYPLISGLV